MVDDADLIKQLNKQLIAAYEAMTLAEAGIEKILGEGVVAKHAPAKKGKEARLEHREINPSGGNSAPASRSGRARVYAVFADNLDPDALREVIRNREDCAAQYMNIIAQFPTQNGATWTSGERTTAPLQLLSGSGIIKLTPDNIDAACAAYAAAEPIKSLTYRITTASQSWIVNDREKLTAWLAEHWTEDLIAVKTEALKAIRAKLAELDSTPTADRDDHHEAKEKSLSGEFLIARLDRSSAIAGVTLQRYLPALDGTPITQRRYTGSGVYWRAKSGRIGQEFRNPVVTIVKAIPGLALKEAHTKPTRALLHDTFIIDTTHFMLPIGCDLIPEISAYLAALESKYPYE